MKNSSVSTTLCNLSLWTFPVVSPAASVCGHQILFVSRGRGKDRDHLLRSSENRALLFQRPTKNCLEWKVSYSRLAFSVPIAKQKRHWPLLRNCYWFSASDVQWVIWYLNILGMVKVVKQSSYHWSANILSTGLLRFSLTVQNNSSSNRGKDTFQKYHYGWC